MSEGRKRKRARVTESESEEDGRLPAPQFPDLTNPYFSTREVAMPHLPVQAPIRTTIPKHAGPQALSPADISAVDRGNLRTAIELHRQVSRPHKNLVASPFNIQAALSMLYTGARTHTAEEMSRGLCWDLPPAQHAAACRAIRAEVMANGGGVRYPYGGGRIPPATLHLAHQMWVDHSLPVEPEFEHALALHFDSTTGRVDFGNTVEASERINSWVSEQTSGCIPRLVTPDALGKVPNGGAKLVLTTAIYLCASWTEPFYMNPEPQPFTPDDEPPRPVRMMTLTKKFATHETQEYEAVDMPYSACALAMRLFRPKHGLAQLEATLREEDLSGTLGNYREIKLTLPPFTVTTDLKLKKPLTQMQLGGMFNDIPLQPPDFSGISKPRQYPMDALRVDEVIHKAFIKVDKNGTEAAAATAIIMGGFGCSGYRPPPPPKLTFDRSFLFMIHDRRRPLFLGRIHAPSEGG